MFGFRKITVHEWQRALARRPGEPTRVLEPGRHARQRQTNYEVVDVRVRQDTTAAQEVLTADGVTVKVTASVQWRISDPVAFTERATDPFAAVYLAVQVAIRDEVGALQVEEVLRTGRDTMVEAMLRGARAAASPLGIEVVSVVVKDLVLPTELRAAFAAVVTGRQEAVAKLEAARAETAALRSLANAAKLLDDHPALAQLRLVQALPYGSTVRLSTSERGDD